MLYFKYFINSIKFINFVENFIIMKELLENIDEYLALPKDHKRDF
ncbi:MAG: hypothetical protein PWQ43_182, partial [Rikenellaceae bacterium]|nr:hypothetical protein [Rikenellaceae bacterium]